MVTLPKNCWPSVLGSFVIQLEAFPEAFADLAKPSTLRYWSNPICANFHTRFFKY